VEPLFGKSGKPLDKAAPDANNIVLRAVEPGRASVRPPF